jgi:hypothetical protein
MFSYNILREETTLTRNALQLSSCFLVLQFLHCVRGEFTDDVSGAAVGLIFTANE